MQNLAIKTRFSYWKATNFFKLIIVGFKVKTSSHLWPYEDPFHLYNLVKKKGVIKTIIFFPKED